jgi:hypothetical protein
VGYATFDPILTIAHLIVKLPAKGGLIVIFWPITGEGSYFGSRPVMGRAIDSEHPALSNGLTAVQGKMHVRAQNGLLLYRCPEVAWGLVAHLALHSRFHKFTVKSLRHI